MENKFDNEECIICGSQAISLLFSCTDHFATGETFPLLRCNNCGFTFTGNTPSEGDIGRYYKSESYISHSDTRRGFINRLYHLARQWMLRSKFRIINKYSDNKQGKLLDIGSGTGYFAAYMNERNWISTGIEADQDARSFAEEKFGLTVYKLNDIKSFNASEFNVVTLWHVLEHLPSPKEVLRDISRILDEKGICVIALPNTDSFDARYYNKHWAAWDVPRHLWHFNLSSFKRLTKDSGLKLISTRRMPLDSFYISMLSEKYRGSVMSLLKGIITGKIGWISSWFNKSRSSSLIYILEKES